MSNISLTEQRVKKIIAQQLGVDEAQGTNQACFSPRPPAPSPQPPATAWRSVFALLLCFTGACDETAESGVDVARSANTCEQADDDDSTGTTCESTFEPGPSVLDHATCEKGKATVAACGTGDLRLRPCDVAWVSRCNEVGGDAVASGLDGPRLTAFLNQPIGCSAMTPLQRPCDRVFQDACDADGSEFVAFSTHVTHGQCVAPEDCKAKATCPNGGKISCTVKGDGACSSQSGQGGFVTCIAIKPDGNTETSGGFCGS
jgi:hypothetical protein